MQFKKNWKVVSFPLCDSTDIESAIFSSFKVSVISDRVEVNNEYLSHGILLYLESKVLQSGAIKSLSKAIRLTKVTHKFEKYIFNFSLKYKACP